jgi:hypothetical protein
MRRGVDIHIPALAVRVTAGVAAVVLITTLMVQGPDTWRYLKLARM